MWKLAAPALVVVVVVAFLFARGNARGPDNAARIPSPEAVLSCVQAAGLAATIETSSTGTVQVSVSHGPARVGANTTMTSSFTSIAYLPSDQEATFFVQQLRGGDGVGLISPDLVSRHGNAVVIVGATATPSARAVIEQCLA